MKTTETPAYRLTSNCIWNSFHHSNKKHIIITGNRGSGKTTLLNTLFPNTLPGITTWAKPQKAVYLKENNTDNVTIVGVYDNTVHDIENKMKLHGDGFSTLGIDALKNVLLSETDWISIDEIGYLPIGEQEAKMFFQLIDRRYEKKSTIVTSNINLSDWNQIFVDNMLASAILDRLVHHSTIVNILGNSYRTATALSKIADKNN